MVNKAKLVETIDELRKSVPEIKAHESTNRSVSSWS